MNNGINHGGFNDISDIAVGYSYNDANYEPKPKQTRTACDNAMETVNRLNNWIYEKRTKTTTTDHQRRKIKACLKRFYKFIEKISAIYSDINAIDYLEESHRSESEITDVLDEILGTEFQHGCYSAGITMLNDEIQYFKDKLLKSSTKTDAIQQIFKDVFFTFNCVFMSIKQTMDKTHSEIVKFSENFNPMHVRPRPAPAAKNTVYITLKLPSQMAISGKEPIITGKSGSSGSKVEKKFSKITGKSKMPPIGKGLSAIPEDSSVNSFTNLITA